MNFKKLFEMQKELDKNILVQHNLEIASINVDKTLALEVEIGELANETRCFKYWSNKKPSPKEKIIEEYVDCLHFILSLGLDYDFSDTPIKIASSDVRPSEQFINLYIDLTDFIVCSSRDHYETLFEDFLTLGFSLGFSEEDIENAYNKKNCINHERQVSGY